MTTELSAEDLDAARRAANTVRRSLPLLPHFEWCDILAYAHVALLQALPGFDSAKSPNRGNWLYHKVCYGIVDQIREIEHPRRVGARPQFCTHIENLDSRPSQMPSPDGLVFEREMLEAVERLPARLQSVIRMRYFLEMTTGETAKAMGVCQSRASQIEKKAMALLRNELTSSSSRRPEAIHEPEADPDPALGFVLQQAA
jgi:RNA polymerase sigma factor (sigma-70 family)